jgi:hypothetical protein
MLQRLFIGVVLLIATAFWAGQSSAGEGETSEEKPPVICDPGHYMSGMSCRGSYCDNVGLACSIRTDAAGSRIAWGSLAEFGSYFSEEGSAMYRCPKNTAIAGFACKGSYCDSISLFCVHTAGVELKNCRPGRWSLSEEAPGNLELNDNEVAVTMRCRGKYCDIKTLDICDVR